MPLIDTQTPINQPIVLILLGPPGAGKGTQAEMISAILPLPHISTGDLLRSNIQEGTDRGKTAKKYMDKGILVPDSLILDMLFARIDQEDCQKGYTLDGFPRTLAQAQAYDKRLGSTTKTIAIHLSLSNESIIDRLKQRVTCKECHTPYHLTFFPPKQEGICDSCQGQLIQRSDDKEAVIKNRLAVYAEQTLPLIHYYTATKSLKEFSCNQPIDTVQKEILDYLREHHPSLKEG